ncbi:MAG: 2,3-bisphosphoglycerate-independent phosphoglycerate mutase [Pseudomonadota bacterium]
MSKPVTLCILDGWGLRSETKGNAPALAKTPCFDAGWADLPTSQLSAHGPDVGLPEGQMGNSEVGHTNIGAGRVVWMDLPRIDNAIADGSFDQNPALGDFVAALKASGGTAHLAGLASPGGVHAHQRHIAHAARVIAGAGVPVKIHAFLDGRDVPPRSAQAQIAQLAADLPKGAALATLTGRFYAMDRDTRWDRVQTAFDALVTGTGTPVQDPQEAIQSAYDAGDSDEFIPPRILGAYGGMADGDGLMFLNFRADRAREILEALVLPGFDAFDVSTRPRFAASLGLVAYSDTLSAHMETLFPPTDIANTLGAWVAQAGKTQLRLAETEKYPHVTFFLNGGVETPSPGETRHMAPSPKVRTYDLAPDMAAQEVGDVLIRAISDQSYDLIIVNFANPDMVGHTGDLDAAIAACEAVDAQLARAVAATRKVGGAMLITADHGNCEVMIDSQTGGPHTAHTLNPVPLILVGGPQGATLAPGKLGDLAPTLLDLMSLPQPDEMTGASLLRKV